MQQERVSVFIDGSNFYHALKAAHGRTQIDFYKLGLRLAGSRKLIRVYYYNAPRDERANPEAYKSQQRFFASLKKTPYLEVKLGRLEERRERTSDGQEVVYHVEKGVDVFLAVDMLKYAACDAYDTAVIVSADGDYAEAVRAVKDLGKHVENAHPKPGRHLQDCCDRVFVLDSGFLQDCWVEPGAART